MVYKHLLPAISIAGSLMPFENAGFYSKKAKPCPWLSSVAWNVLKQLTVFQRYMVYSCWETRYKQFLLQYSYKEALHTYRYELNCSVVYVIQLYNIFNYEEAKFEAKKILKRVVSADKSDRDDPNAYRPVLKISFHAS